MWTCDLDNLHNFRHSRGRGRERAVRHGHAARRIRVRLGSRRTAVRDRAAARRLLFPARADRTWPGRHPAPRGDRGAGPRRRDRAGAGRPGRHGQDAAGGRVRPHDVEYPRGGGPGLGERRQPGLGRDRLRAGGERDRRQPAGRERGSGRGPVRVLAGADQAAVGPDPRRPGRAERPGRAVAGRRLRPGPGHHPAAGLGLRRTGIRRRAGHRGQRAEPPRGPRTTSPPGCRTTPTSGSRRWTWARTWKGCRSGWPRPPR